MIDRPFWRERILAAWRRAPIAWLAGVRRSGKTTLARSFEGDGALYLDCDLPAVEDMVRDPERFYRNCSRPAVIFDEIHQLSDPSRVLKIGADLFPKLRILATGSSTPAATRKFKDTLTGRKRSVRLLPALWDEFAAFGGATLHKRLDHGGLPPALLLPSKDAGFYREWADSFYARDVAKLFGVRAAEKFNAFFEFLLRQSGGLLDLTKAAGSLGVSRPTLYAYLGILETTHAVTIVRPFFGGGGKELVRTPKVYGFDTGFVSFFRGWSPLRTADMGQLWEHLVLEWLLARLPDLRPQHWRDASGREVDFVLWRSRDGADAIECKWDAADLDPRGLKAFRDLYPKGRNFLVAPISAPPHPRRIGGVEVTVTGPAGLNGGRRPYSPIDRRHGGASAPPAG